MGYWAATRASPLLPPHPKAVLGTVSHKTLERGEILSRKGQQTNFEEVWENTVTEIEKELISSRITACLVPLANLKGYDLAKEHCKLIFRSSIKEHFYRKAGRRPIKNVLPLGIERTLECNDLHIKGRPDRVDIIGGELVIIDFKTGDLAQLEENAAVQLKAYAKIYQLLFTKWPDALAVLDKNGNMTKIGFNHEECEGIIAQMVSFHKNINSVVSKTGLSDNNKSKILARPGIKTCNFCNFRPGCEIYREGLIHNKNDYGVNDVCGRIINYYPDLKSGGKISLKTNSGQELSVNGIPANWPYLIGDGVAIFGLIHQKREHYFDWAKCSMVYSCP